MDPVSIGLTLAGQLLPMLFGDDEPGGQQSIQGFSALPPQAQEAYLQQFLPGAVDWYQQGLNPYQQQAMASLGGGPDAFKKEMGQYMMPYQQQVIDPVLANIQKQHDITKSQLIADISKLGGLGAGNPATHTGTQNLLRQLEEGTHNARATAQGQLLNQGYDRAMNARQQGLQNQMAAGDMPRQHIQNLGALLQQFPSSSNASVAPPGNNWAEKLGGGMMTLAGYAQNPQVQQAFPSIFGNQGGGSQYGALYNPHYYGSR